MLALTMLTACKVHAPVMPCGHVLLGACVDPPVALTPCERGRARNLDDSSCVTTRDTRDLARSAGVYADENDVIECESTADELVASARLGKLACVARPGPSPSPCPASTVREGGGCLPVKEKGGALDVATWSRAAAAEVCSRLLRSSLGIERPEREARLTVELSVSVPNNDVTFGFAQVKTKPAVAEQDLARAVRPVDDALRRFGDTATASEASAAATCRTSSRRPISVP